MRTAYIAAVIAYPARRTVALVSDAPVELLSLVDDDGRMFARRDGEPNFTGVENVADAIMAALARGVDLVVPRRLFNEIRDAFPPELPHTSRCDEQTLSRSPLPYVPSLGIGTYVVERRGKR